MKVELKQMLIKKTDFLQESARVLHLLVCFLFEIEFSLQTCECVWAIETFYVTVIFFHDRVLTVFMLFRCETLQSSGNLIPK